MESDSVSNTFDLLLIRFRLSPFLKSDLETMAADFIRSPDIKVSYSNFILRGVRQQNYGNKSYWSMVNPHVFTSSGNLFTMLGLVKFRCLAVHVSRWNHATIEMLMGTVVRYYCIPSDMLDHSCDWSCRVLVKYE